MKALSDYTIRCTPEQVCKAINLGAMLDICDWRHVDTPSCMTMTNNGELIGHFMLPTAEQMIGWLEEQGVRISIYGHSSYSYISQLFDNSVEKYFKVFYSRPEATLATIDAALDYLLTKKQKNNKVL